MSKSTPGVEPSQEATETLLSHLIELRDRILRMFIAILVVFLLLFPFANPIYTWLADPLMQHLPEGTSMIAIDVAAPFLIPFKLVLLLAIVISIPYLLYQLWSFVAPGSTPTRRAWPCRWWRRRPRCSISAWPSPTLWCFR